MKKIILYVMCLPLMFIGCTDQLDVTPEVEQSLENLLAKDPNATAGILAKLYSNLTLHGQGTPGSSDQNQDIAGDDAGETVYLRGYVNMQELTADLVKNGWGDNGLDPLTTSSGWQSTNKFFGYFYNKLYNQIAQCNSFIIQLNSGEIPDFSEKSAYLAETRFLRALAYYHGMDAFGGMVIVTDADGTTPPKKARSSRADVFKYVESELLDVLNTIPATNQYGRANKAAVQMTLAKIYLNAKVYTGTERWTDAAKYAKMVMDDGQYSVANTPYLQNFTGDNQLSKEIIFAIPADEVNSQSYGNATYIINGSFRDGAVAQQYGSKDAWGGHRMTPILYQTLFGYASTTSTVPDKRALFYTTGQNFTMNDYKAGADGFLQIKFRNKPYTGSLPITSFTRVDFPLYRQADAYLMYAEAILRSGGDKSLALAAANTVRTRAFGNTSGNITLSELTLDFILDERGRELYFEGFRRQDLIRFDKFTGGSYLWPFKGGVKSGTAIPTYYNVFPLPLTALQANPLLEQNPNY